MKAAQINEYGDASIVRVQDVATPSPAKDQILVKIHAASLNPFDTIVRAGYMKEMIPLQFPVTLGGDIAGTVEAIGEDVTNLSVGDRVYGQASAVSGDSGALAEFALTHPDHVAPMPTTLDFNQAASLPLIGTSAIQALEDHIKLQSGQKLFIHGGAGNIGMIAIQLAKHLGAYVATTATSDNIAFIKELGADEVIDYKNQDFTSLLKGYDAVFDTVGGDDFTKSLAILRPEGVAVSMAADADQTITKGLNVQTIHQMTAVTTTVLDKLTSYVEKGVISPQIGEILPLDHSKEAFELRESGAVRGKIVIELAKK